jgi:hypothetical protein
VLHHNGGQFIGVVVPRPLVPVVGILPATAVVLSDRYMNISPTLNGHRSAAMTLLALETMPCGCVTGVYQARPTVVEVEFVEAKGPHCVFSRHRAGHVTRLGVPESMVADTGEPLV